MTEDARRETHATVDYTSPIKLFRARPFSLFPVLWGGGLWSDSWLAQCPKGLASRGEA